jgi:hypothetical protein
MAILLLGSRDLFRVAFDSHVCGRRPREGGRSARRRTMERDLLPPFDHRLLPDRPGVRAGAGNVVELWAPPVWARHITILLMLFNTILMGAYIFKKSHIAIAAHHPMVWTVRLGTGHSVATVSPIATLFS